MEYALAPLAHLRLDDTMILLYPGQALSLGRSAESDIVLRDPQISRSHAMLEWTSNGFAIRDLASANGTSINGEALADAPRLLHDGDVLTICSQTLVYEILRSAAEPAPAGARQSQRPALLVAAGPDRGQAYPLWGEIITIGRASHDATWEIRLTDRSISRPHARLEQVAEGYLLSDLNSANGTTLNGSPLRQPALLRDQDQIGVGESMLLFRG